MTQDNKTPKNHTKKAKRSTKATKNNTAKQKSSLLLRFIPKTRKGVIRMVLVVIVVVAIAGAIPLPYTSAKSDVVAFATESKESDDLELGNSKILQEGREGSKTVTMSSLQSLWGRLFGWQPIQQKEVTSRVTEKPANKVVANGTRKYQYMLCSDGSYRYYTDEQFKDADTGFTSKSDDYCKENNQGVKLKLADSSAGTVNNQNTSDINNLVTVPNGCRKSAIPFKTEYQNTTTMQKGTKKVASQGRDGYTLSCQGTSDITLAPVDQLVFIGTGQTDAEVQAEKDAAEVKRQQEQAEKQNERWRNIRNCVSQLTAQGVQPAQAQSKCEQLY